MTGLKMLRAATKVMIDEKGENTTIRLKTLMNLIDIAIKQDDRNAP